MAGDEQFLQQLAYSSAFKNIQAILVQRLSLDNCLLKLREANIVDTDIQTRIASEDDVQCKNKILVQHLQKVNNVSTYNNFLTICDVLDTELTDRIRREIAKELQTVGLPAEYNPSARGANLVNDSPKQVVNTANNPPPCTVNIYYIHNHSNNSSVRLANPSNNPPTRRQSVKSASDQPVRIVSRTQNTRARVANHASQSFARALKFANPLSHIARNPPARAVNSANNPSACTCVNSVNNPIARAVNPANTEAINPSIRPMKQL